MNLHLQMFVHFVFGFVYIVQIYLLVSQNYENGAVAANHQADTTRLIWEYTEDTDCTGE